MGTGAEDAGRLGAPGLLTARFDRALEYAREHHADDVRKGTSVPYVSHLLAVSAIVLEHGGGEDEAIGALLHDVVEDGGGPAALAEIRSLFGDKVVTIVEGCSDTMADDKAAKPPWRARKEAYIGHLATADPSVLLVSAADKLHNARAILADVEKLGEELWERFNAGVDDQLWYYGALRDAFRSREPVVPEALIDDLAATVHQIGQEVKIAAYWGTDEWEKEASRHRLAVLQAAADAHDADRPLDIAGLAASLEVKEESVRGILGELHELGLCSPPLQEGESPFVTSVGRQYLQRRGDVPDDALVFLARFVDDLDARAALLEGCTAVIDEFSGAMASGNGVEHARRVVPSAFAAAVDERLAVRLFAAAVALTTRLAEDKRAGCVAEEILAVSVIEAARDHLARRRDDGELSDEQLDSAENALHGVFELFQDDDVLDLFDMAEPADAALAGHSEINRQLAVVDQRLEAWFRPFAWALPTGYLDARLGDEPPSSRH